MPGTRRLVGRCPVFFLLAASFDVVGLSLILVGIFVNLEKDGRSFGEFLIYSGGIMVFFSLLWWLAWYSLNLEVSLQELLKDPSVTPRRSNLVQLARKFSERFSKRGRRKGVSKDALGAPNPPGDPLHLTPTAFFNNGFTIQLGSPGSNERHLELSRVCGLGGSPGIVGTPDTVDRLI